MKQSIFNQTIQFAEVAKRNIVFVTKPQKVFANIADDNDDIALINLITESARNSLTQDNSIQDFFYTTAIGYPFRTLPYMQSRFSDGSYPVWYGSKTVDTTIYETVFHAANYLQAEAGIDAEKVIIKKRTLFNVHCDAFLLDLTNKATEFPELLSRNYDLTNSIGKQIKEGGLPGILYRSTRHDDGINLSIFTEKVLSKPQLLGHLQYHFNLKENKVKITGMNRSFTISL